MMNTETCNHEVIDDFLADRLTETEQAAFEQHLNDCDECCTLLSERTADVTLWNDARAFLSSTDNVPVSTDTRVGCSNRLPHPINEPSNLDFLNATDDPRMLGRFAGYEISGVVGCGGMGIVLKGFDSALNRYAAIKVLAPHYASSGAARQRFAREAQAAAAVVHDNVIAIHGVDEFNSLPYLVMPYIKGQSLQKRIDRHGPLSTAEVLRIAMQTARGLAAAHEQGLVHRDIKPANILLPENVERVLITDFGLARAADDASLTRSGVIAGTPQYMSPEQARGEGIDHRSDLFSLGSVMYAMCTGRPPFRAETPYGILRRITDNAHRRIQEINPDTPSWLARVIDRLLEKEPEQRFASAEEVAHLLEDCLAHVQQPTKCSLPSILQPGRGGTGLRVAAAIMIVGVALAVAFRPSSSVEESATEREQSGAGQRSVLPEASSEPSVVLSVAKTEPEVTEIDLRWHTDQGLDRIESTLGELNQVLSDDFTTDFTDDTDLNIPE